MVFPTRGGRCRMPCDFALGMPKKTKHPARLCPSPRVQHLDKPPSSLNILELSKAGSIDNGSIGESVSNTCSKGLAEPHEYIYPRDGLRRPRRVNAAFWARSPGLRLASTSHRSMPFSPPGHGGCRRAVRPLWVRSCARLLSLKVSSVWAMLVGRCLWAFENGRSTLW